MDSLRKSIRIALKKILYVFQAFCIIPIAYRVLRSNVNTMTSTNVHCGTLVKSRLASKTTLDQISSTTQSIDVGQAGADASM